MEPITDTVSFVPEEGSHAPAISLPDQDGVTHTLDQYAGQWIVLYFYPKDDTPGCTIESCGFRDMHKEFTDANAVILGVSCDDEKSHTKFIEKFALPFTLLADTEHKTVQEYGVWKEKNMYGKKYMGIARTTFLIDPEGNIAKIYRNVKPDGHNQEVLQECTQLEASQ